MDYGHEQEALKRFEEYHGDEAELAGQLERGLDFDYPENLLEGFDEREGKERVRSVLTSVNQQAFRALVFRVFRETCCITGFDLPTVNRASHIVGWVGDESTRMDPGNGLCLSATYDAAFDRHLLSLDAHYRIILPRDLKEHDTSESVRAHFQDREGERLALPKAYRPLTSHLERHRAKGRF